MGALYTCAHPKAVCKLVLLAPALILPEFAADPPAAVDVPTVIVHGEQDTLIPIDEVRRLAEGTFTNLDFRVVDDDHGLGKTAEQIDWAALLQVE